MQVQPSSAEVQPLSARALTDLVAEELTRAILGGVFQPGERLVERDLAERFAVSKTPVREALRDLSSRGLLVSRHYRGTEVVPVDEQMMREIYEVRAALEPEAIRLATPHHDAESCAALRRVLNQAATAAQTGDLVELSVANRLFHSLLYAPCPNARLKGLIEALRDQVALITVSGWRQSSTWEDEAREHSSIVDAVEQRDAKAAAARLRAHIQRARKSLSSLIPAREAARRRPV
jgi:DNA-binding GntR family transcriptional regulator